MNFLKNKEITPWTALILSAAILPGLGQLLTGRMLRGTIMAGTLLLWLPYAVIKVGVDVKKVMPHLMEKAAAAPLTFGDIQAALSPMKGSLTWVFMPLVLIWFYSLTDSILYIIATRKIKAQ